MKKVYMKPGMEAYNMNVESLICLSKTSTPANPNNEVLSREFDDWEEDIDFSDVDL